MLYYMYINLKKNINGSSALLTRAGSASEHIVFLF